MKMSYSTMRQINFIKMQKPSAIQFCFFFFVGMKTENETNKYFSIVYHFQLALIGL